MHEEALVILPQVLAEAQIDSAVLIGHSDGGSIALIHAGQVEGSPVRGLALMAPHVFNEPICVEAITNAGERYRGADLRERLEPHHRSNVDVAFWGWHDVWVHPEFRDWSIEPSLPGITVPTLVIQGDRDPYGTMRHLHAIRTSTSGRVEPVVLEGCGHSPHRERTEDTCAALVGFLSRLAQAAP